MRMQKISHEDDFIVTDVLKIARGDVYYASLDPVVGSETGKTRPVLIIQNDIGNRYSPTTIVAIITNYSAKKASYPICVAVGKSQGLPKESIVNLSQIRTIDKKRLLEPKLTSLTDDVMDDVDEALKNSLAIEE
jgi:mRNA interferase MazF